MSLSKEEQHTLAFLKMTVIELRRMAEEAPEMADRILGIVQQIEAETVDMEWRGSEAHTQ
jgi:hypothetical protein